MTAKLYCDIGVRHLLIYQIRLSVIEVLGYPEPHMVVEVLHVTKTTGSMHMICETVILVLLGVFHKICQLARERFVMLHRSCCIIQNRNGELTAEVLFC
jgi:hypothetical protein